MIHPAQHVKYPDDPLLKFKANEKQHKVPFFLVCDFESFIVPVHADEEQEEEDDCRTRVIDELGIRILLLSRYSIRTVPGTAVRIQRTRRRRTLLLARDAGVQRHQQYN